MPCQFLLRMIVDLVSKREGLHQRLLSRGHFFNCHVKLLRAGRVWAATLVSVSSGVLLHKILHVSYYVPDVVLSALQAWTHFILIIIPGLFLTCFLQRCCLASLRFQPLCHAASTGLSPRHHGDQWPWPRVMLQLRGNFLYVTMHFQTDLRVRKKYGAPSSTNQCLWIKGIDNI